MQRRNGFTLVEAAVAIGVVVILSGIIAPLAMKSFRDAQFAAARNDLQVIAAAITSQLKDTRCRPSAASGKDGATGAGQAVWASTTTLPGVAGAAAQPAKTADGTPTQTQSAAGVALTVSAANSFANLFSAPNAEVNQTQANSLFGLPDGGAITYQGPYLSRDVASKPDPWGTAYLILGYNAASQASGGPIWVVCAGPSKTIHPSNLAGATDGYPATWTTDVGANANLALRVN
jgi:type II secretory pathway pseudopilin PulG